MRTWQGTVSEADWLTSKKKQERKKRSKLQKWLDEVFEDVDDNRSTLKRYAPGAGLCRNTPSRYRFQRLLAFRLRGSTVGWVGVLEKVSGSGKATSARANHRDGMPHTAAH